VSEDKDKLKRYFEQKQQRLTEAYDVLSHPSKRSLYDRFGTVDFQLVKVEGVETEDLIETLSSQKRQKRAAIREMRTNASTQTVMNIDATNLIGAVLNGGELQGQETFITVPSTSMSQNFQVCLLTTTNSLDTNFER
jgi:DnaJ-class molecular chaperone